MKIYMVSLLHRATINNWERKQELPDGTTTLDLPILYVDI